jgi:replicative DNA helicase
MDPLLALTLRVLMRHKDWVQYQTFLDTSAFPNAVAVAIYEVLEAAHAKSNKDVSEMTLRSRISAAYKLKRKDELLSAVDHIMEVEEDDLDDAEDAIRQYTARTLALKMAGYVSARADGPTLDYTHVAEMASRANIVAHGQLSSRVESREAGLPGDEDMVRHTVPLGLHPELDAKLMGGMAVGELLLLLALFGVGKTSYLYRIVTNFVQAGEGVLCFTKEIAPYKCWNRYYQGLTGLTSTELLTAQKLVKKRKNDVPGYMWMENYCGQKLSPSIVKAIGEEMLAKEEPLTAIMIDYMQICTPDGRFQNNFEGLSQMVVDFREVANYLGVKMISAWQVKREGWVKNVFGPDDIARSWDAVQHADIIGGLNQTEEEKGNNYLRLKLMKQREDPDLPLYELHSDMRRLIIGPWDKRKEAVDANVDSRSRSGVRKDRRSAGKRRRTGGV